MKQFFKNRSIWRFVFFASGMVGGFIVLIVLALSSLRQEAIQTHRHIASLHANTLEEHFSQVLQQVDHALDRLPFLVAASSGETPYEDVLEQLLHNAPYLRSLSLLSLEGLVLHSSHASNKGIQVPLGDFLPIPFGENAVLRLGTPWSGRDLHEGRPSSPLRPVPIDGISFLPVIKHSVLHEVPYIVLASINTDYFMSRYGQALPLEQGTVSVWRTDGILLFSTSPLLPLGVSHYTPLHPRDAPTLYEHFLLNKHQLLDTVRLASTMPFVVEVSMDEETVLGYWDKERSKVLWVSVLLVFLSGALGLLLLVRYYRENERQRLQLAYEKQFRVAMEATQTGVWTWDYVENQVTWDSQCFLLLGYAPDAFAPSIEKIKALTHPDDVVSMFASIGEQILAQHGFLIERRMQTAKGEWIWIQVRGKVIDVTPLGYPKLLTGVYINVDAQKKAEEKHLMAVAFETQEAILITDASEKIVKVNEAFTRITGYAESEVVGKTPRIFKSGQHDKAFYDAMWKVLRTEKFWQGEVWNKRKNGEVYAEHLSITAICNEEGDITHFLANFNDITTHKIAQKKMQELAFQDPLTHLANRAAFEERLQKAFLECLKEAKYTALLFLDLDYFKALNDQYGHDAGDMLLVQVANRLEDVTRGHDMVARLGGDEFVVLLENLSQDRAYALSQTRVVAQKILTRLCEPYPLAHGNYTIGASIGIALIDGRKKSPQEVLKEADKAMYQAKQRGRNQVFAFEE